MSIRPTLLFLSAEPSSLGFQYRFAGEEQLIRDAVGDSLHVVERVEVRPNQIGEYIDKYHPAILHIAASDDGQGNIQLENEQRAVAPLPFTRLADLLTSRAEDLRLVYLNCCNSLEAAKQIATTIPCAIGHPGVTADEDAYEFARLFYRAIASSKSVANAFSYAKGELPTVLTNKNSFSFPELCCNSTINPKSYSPLTGARIKPVGSSHSPADVGLGPGQESSTRKRFAVALSFPGEHRDYVEKIAKALAASMSQPRVFYDRYYEAELSRPNLDTYLQTIYHDDSELVVVVLCQEYDEKDWCGLEFRAIRDLIKKRRDDEIMFVRVADGDVKGVFGIDGYVDAKNRPAEEIAQVICERHAFLRSRNP